MSIADVTMKVWIELLQKGGEKNFFLNLTQPFACKRVRVRVPSCCEIIDSDIIPKL